MIQLLICFVLFCFPAFATDYYFSSSGNDTTGDGSIATPWATLAKAEAVINTSCAEGDNYLFKKGDTFTDGGINISGCSNKAITIGNYGTGDLPIFDPLETRSFTWTNVSGNIYSAPITNGVTFPTFVHNPTMVYEGSNRLRGVPWTSDEATALALMSAGTYTVDNSTTSGRKVYVWVGDGGDPNGKTMKFSKVDFIIQANYHVQNNINHLTIDGIEFRHANRKAIQLGDLTCADNVDYSVVQNCRFIDNAHGASVCGIQSKLLNNYAYDSGGDASFEGNKDAPSFSTQCTTNGEVSNNISDVTRMGTHIEINFTSNDGLVFGNMLTRGAASCIENYYSYRNKYYKNYCDGSGSLFTQRHNYGIMVSGDDNTIDNNVFLSNLTGGVRLGVGEVNAYDAEMPPAGSRNIVSNNTVVAPVGGYETFTLSAASVFIYSGSTYSGSGTNGSKDNVIKNNIFYSDDATDYAVIFLSGRETGNILDYNDYYYGGENFLGRYYADDKASLALWRTASSQDANSINKDPLFKSDYSLKSNSPARDAGITLAEVLDDYLGITRPKGSAYDIGAFEFSLAPGIYIR